MKLHLFYFILLIPILAFNACEVMFRYSHSIPAHFCILMFYTIAGYEIPLVFVLKLLENRQYSVLRF